MEIQKTLGVLMTPVVTDLVLMQPALAKVKTASHVYQQTERIVAEIRLVRQAFGVADTPRTPGVQVKKKPLHVYSKSLELLEKVARSQSKKGLPPAKVGHIPLQKITPAEVCHSPETILKEIHRLKEKLGIADNKINNPKFVSDKKPSDVYKNMWRASYMMDGVAGQISPSNVYKNTQIILKELERKKGISIAATAPAAVAGKRPKHANLQGFKNMYYIVKVQRKLKIDPMRVPPFPSGKITPSDVYDTTYNFIAEIVRIKVSLGIETPQVEIALEDGKMPPMVLTQMQLIGKYLKKTAKEM